MKNCPSNKILFGQRNAHTYTFIFIMKVYTYVHMFDDPRVCMKPNKIQTYFGLNLMSKIKKTDNQIELLPHFGKLIKVLQRTILL